MRKIILFLIKYRASILLFLILVMLQIVFNLYMLRVDVIRNASEYKWKAMTMRTLIPMENNPFPKIAWELFVRSIVTSLLFQIPIVFVIKLFRTEFHRIAKIVVSILAILINSLFIRELSYGMSNVWMEALYETDIWNRYNYFAGRQSWFWVFPTSAVIMIIAIYVRLIESGSIKKHIMKANLRST